MAEAGKNVPLEHKKTTRKMKGKQHWNKCDCEKWDGRRLLEQRSETAAGSPADSEENPRPSAFFNYQNTAVSASGIAQVE